MATEWQAGPVRRPIIELRNVARVYETGRISVAALAGVDLRVDEGEFVAIVGPSGSGKSTLMNLLGCLDRPTSGTYLLDGTDVGTLDDDGLASLRSRRIGFVFQSYNLLPRTSALDNVATPLMYQGVPAKQRQERARNTLVQLGLGDRLDHEPTELSGGQQQRVAVARALVTNPADHPRRRAHRQPRHALRRRGHGRPPRPPPQRPHDHPHHARGRCGRPGAASDPHPRRAGAGMRTLDMVRLAMSRLRTSRLRTALTMLGVIIGVASVVALVAVGQGTTANVTDRLSELGTNLLTINPGSAQQAGTFGGAGSAETLTLDDAEALDALEVLAGVAPEMSTSQLVVAGDANTTTTILGTTADYPHVRSYELWQGSGLTDASVEGALRVAVIGATTADDIGLAADGLGSEVEIGGLPFVVVGILQEKGGAGFQDPDDQVLIPVTTLQKYFSGSDAVRTIAVSARSEPEIDAAKAAVTDTLRGRHGLAVTDADDFQILDQAQLLETVSAVTDTLTLMLAGIASISLIVGGIGIMNIMLVSVRERTREIGIRKAIGARSRDILSQFLVESVTLSLVGGLAGAVLGVAITVVIASVAGWAVSLDLGTIAVALGFSVAIGVIFGVWPARQAARLDPITALRFE